MVAENFTWPYNWRLLSRVNIPTPTFNEIAAFGPHALLGSYGVLRSFCRPPAAAVKYEKILHSKQNKMVNSCNGPAAKLLPWSAERNLFNITKS